MCGRQLLVLSKPKETKRAGIINCEDCNVVGQLIVALPFRKCY